MRLAFGALLRGLYQAERSAEREDGTVPVFAKRLMTGMVLMLGSMAMAFTAMAGQPGDTVYLLDLTALHGLDLKDPVQAKQAWDTAHVAASAQGIINRESPRLFLRFMADVDHFWWNYFQEEGGWLAGKKVKKLASIEEMLTMFRADFKGIVVYRTEVAATSNLASTIAGVEDRICLRYDPAEGSVCQRVMALDLGGLDVLRLFNEDGSPWFTGEGTIRDINEPSTGSAKCDAYMWACRRFLDTGKCSADYMAYYIDTYWLKKPTLSGISNATLTNHDFFISNRAFFFDLHMWDEEAPVDEPGQPAGTDARTLRRILRSMHSNTKGEIFNIGGFVPWAWKYTSHGEAGSKHGPVDSEWRYAQIISAYNGVMDADALGFSGMANASFYRHFPMQEHYPQNPRPTEKDLRERGFISAEGKVAPFSYVLFYMGDYDSAAWLQFHIPLMWADPAHEETLCTWAFNPNLKGRAPHALHYARTHQSANDWFMAGDSGAGYLNPGMLLAPRMDPELPDGLDAWVRYNKPFFDQFDLSITGFVIDGHSPGMGERGMDAYMQFSQDGMVAQKIPPQGLHRDTMPYVRMKTDLYAPPKEAGPKIASLAGINGPRFNVVRTILKTPTYHKKVMAETRKAPGGDMIRFVDPYTFFLLLKTHERTKSGAAVAE